MGREHSAPLPNDPMPDRERSPKERVEVAAPGPKRNLAVTQPERAQLPPRNNAMLPLRQLTYRTVHASGAPFALHGCIRRTGAEFAPPGLGD